MKTSGCFLDRTKHETIFLKEKKQFSFSFDKKVKNLLRTKLILGHKSWTISVQGFEKKNCLFVLVGQNQNRTPIRWLKVQSLGLKFLGKVNFFPQVDQGFHFSSWHGHQAERRWHDLDLVYEIAGAKILANVQIRISSRWRRWISELGKEVGKN